MSTSSEPGAKPSYSELEAKLEAVVAERERLREVAIEHGACYCTWDVTGPDGVDHGHDVIYEPAKDCPVHGSSLSPSTGEGA